jgi:type I restriction enzyme S subunit
MSWPVIALSDFCRTGSGGTPSRRKNGEYYGGHIPWVKSGELLDDVLNATDEHITDAALRESSAKMVPAGAVLIAMYGATVGRTALLEIDATTNQAVCFVLPDPKLAVERYVWHALRASYDDLLAKRVGGAQPNISQQIIRHLKVPLPPLAEQRRIVEIVDQADALRKLRREADAKAARILPSLFLKMFGDPTTNPMGWPTMPVRALASQYSDGPFGSNLKSSHYVSDGVRVIRLQNIGVGKFLDEDKAFVSQEHFNTLVRHKCLPGDVLIGTLGEPNLRACIQPRNIEVALNKADCVQLRPDPEIATPEYVCWLLNMPSTLALAQDLVLGQTRARISMGRLGGLTVPKPPIELQRKFSSEARVSVDLVNTTRLAGKRVETLFANILARAFSGQLTATWRQAHMQELLIEMQKQARLLNLPAPN